jgi:hypothetical protein
LGETSEQALVWELREETGVTPTKWRLLGEFRELFSGGEGSLVLHLRCDRLDRRAEQRSREEHTEVSWFAVEDACCLALAHPAYPGILRRATLGTMTAPRLWRRWPGQIGYAAGAWLLVASMAGSLVFGLLYHFLVPGPDNVFTQHAGTWRVSFGVTAVLRSLLQVIGVSVGLWAV